MAEPTHEHRGRPDWNRQCPDGGTCHHTCDRTITEDGYVPGPCLRVLIAGPLSGVYPGDEWPQVILDAELGGEEGASAGVENVQSGEVIAEFEKRSDGWTVHRFT